MSNAITIALRQAYDERARLGEEVTFRESDFFVPQINRAPSEQDRARLHFNDFVRSIIELPFDLEDGAPTAGEDVEDGDGRHHRIRQIHYDGVCYVVGCQVSDPIPEPDPEPAPTP